MALPFADVTEVFGNIKAKCSNRENRLLSRFVKVRKYMYTLIPHYETIEIFFFGQSEGCHRVSARVA